MPTYEYACDACRHRYERFQSITVKPDVVCPECGKKKVRRVISLGGGFILKGSGFYNTEYRSGSQHKAKSEGEGKASSTDSKDTAKTESKPAEGKAKTPDGKASKTKP